MSGRPGRARHTAGRSGVNRDSRMPLPESFPSDRRHRRRRASLRAEAREYTAVTHHNIVVNTVQQPPSAAEFRKGWFFDCVIRSINCLICFFFGIETITRPFARWLIL